MIRSIAAVAAGYLVFAGSAALLFQLSGQPPHAPASRAFEIGTIIWGVVFALIAGWLTARIAVRHPAMHAVVLAALIALGALLSLLLSSSGSAIWTQVAALLLMAPAALAGGALARRNLEPIA
jgi:multisubunit Na+/H+ antiporter MnhE subunit